MSPLYILVTHLYGLAVNSRTESIPGSGIYLGVAAVRHVAAPPLDDRLLYVAKRHVRIFFQENMWCAQALDCGLHTVINDEILEPESIVPVAPGDVMELGFARLAFMDHEVAVPLPESEPWQEAEPAAEDTAAAGRAWREISVMGEPPEDILRHLGHEGLRVLDEPETLSQPVWQAIGKGSPGRAVEREAHKDLWQLCGSPEDDGKNLTDLVMGEVTIDDVLSGLKEEHDLCGQPATEDPLELLGPLEAGSARTRRAGNTWVASAGTERRAMTLDSHYAPDSAAEHKDKNHAESSYKG